MAALLKERARKPVISHEIGIALPTFKVMDGTGYYVVEIREPWAKGGYQTFQLLLTEKEMIGMVSEWMQRLARTNR